MFLNQFIDFILTLLGFLNLLTTILFGCWDMVVDFDFVGWLHRTLSVLGFLCLNCVIMLK